MVSKEEPNKMEGLIVEVLLKQTDTPLDTVKLFTSLYVSYQNHEPVMITGTGYGLFYTVDYAYLTGLLVQDDNVLLDAAQLHFQLRSGEAAQKKGSQLGNDTNIQQAGNSCTDWYNARTGDYITSTGDCGGGGGGGVPTGYNGGGGPGGMGNGPSGYGGHGGLGNGGSGALPTTLISNGLAPCARIILNSLRNLRGNDIGGIFALFGTSTTAAWTIQSGVLPTNTNGITVTTTAAPFSVTTTISTDLTSHATNIAVARTLIHESLHAYMGRWGRLHNMSPNTTLDNLLDGYMRGTGFDANQQHALMATIVSQMADALQGYCNANGILLQHERAENLFWSGLLRTDAYALLSTTRKDMITRENVAEQQNTNVPNPNVGGVNIQPQGTRACN